MRNRPYFSQIARWRRNHRVAQNIHRHHSFGRQLPLRAHCLDLPFQALRAQAVGIRRDVAENGGGAEHLGGLRGGNEGHVRTEHRVPRSHSRHHIGQLQCVRAVGAGDAVFTSGKGSQFFLQLLHIGPPINCAESRTARILVSISVFRAWYCAFRSINCIFFTLSF